MKSKLIQHYFRHIRTSSRYRWATRRGQQKQWSDLRSDQCQYYSVRSSAGTCTEILIIHPGPGAWFYSVITSSSLSECSRVRVREGHPNPTNQSANPSEKKQQRMSFASENWSHNLFRAQQYHFESQWLKARSLLQMIQMRWEDVTVIKQKKTWYKELMNIFSSCVCVSRNALKTESIFLVSVYTYVMLCISICFNPTKIGFRIRFSIVCITV